MAKMTILDQWSDGCGATSTLLWYIDLNGSVGANLNVNGAYSITLNASGLISLGEGA